jgi:uncharacterized protein YwgA
MSNALSVIKAIQQSADSSPCKKKVQKITYLLQEANNKRVFDYSIHFYGPYSAELDSEIRYLYSRGDLDIDITAREHNISVNNSQKVPCVNSNDKKIIENFSSRKPSELELLTTALYIQRAIPNANDKTIIDGVIKFKGNKYSTPQIEEAIKELKNKKYF